MRFYLGKECTGGWRSVGSSEELVGEGSVRVPRGVQADVILESGKTVTVQAANSANVCHSFSEPPVKVVLYKAQGARDGVVDNGVSDGPWAGLYAEPKCKDALLYEGKGLAKSIKLRPGTAVKVLYADGMIGYGQAPASAKKMMCLKLSGQVRGYSIDDATDESSGWWASVTQSRRVN